MPNTDAVSERSRNAADKLDGLPTLKREPRTGEYRPG